MRWLIDDDPEAPVQTYYRGIDNGKIIVETYQDVEKVIDNNKRLQNEGKGYTPSREMRRIASIPLNILQMWAAADQVNIFTMKREEKMAYIRRKLADPDWRHLRTSSGGL